MPQLVACEGQRRRHFTTDIQLFDHRWLEEGHPYSSDEFVRQRTFGPKTLSLECHVLLGLGVKGRVLDQCVHKHPDVVLHLVEQTGLSFLNKRVEKTLT